MIIYVHTNAACKVSAYFLASEFIPVSGTYFPANMLRINALYMAWIMCSS